jgi:hypothetical protein
MPNLAAKIASLEKHRAAVARLQIEIAEELQLPGVPVKMGAGLWSGGAVKAPRKQKPTRKRVTPEILLRMGQMLLAVPRKKGREIAEELGVSIPTIWGRRKEAIKAAKAEATRQAKQQPPKPPAKPSGSNLGGSRSALTEDERLRILELSRQKVPQVQIENLTGRSKKTIQRVLKAAKSQP